MFFRLAILFCFAFILSCQSTGSPNLRPTIPKANWDEATEESWLLNMSAEMRLDELNQDDVERNAIIAHAMEEQLDIRELDESGLWIVVHRIGDAEQAKLKWGQKVKIHYRGTFLDGTVFDESYGKGKPLEFYIGNVIHGWNMALETLHPRAFATILVPSRLAYGVEGMKDSDGRVIIPGDTPLRFDLEVVSP